MEIENQVNDNKNQVNNGAIEYLNGAFEIYSKLQKTIWKEAELGFLEFNSSLLLQNHLKENEFSVESGVSGMPTAFVASYGSGSPVIGLLAEFDALPGLSQDAVPFRKPLIEGGNGHGCGHNVLGVGSVAAAVAIKKWLEQNNIEGSIKLFGTPAEEGGGGKVYMVRDGIFDGVDVVLDWHPGTDNFVNIGSGTAVVMIDYSFHGKSSHAANSPDKGRSALDGVEAMNFMVNLMREHIPISSRIHYVISHGGESANIVPDYAKVSYYIRHPNRDELKKLIEWVDMAAEGAAKGTQTKVESELLCGYYEKLDNRKLAELIQEKLEIVGGLEYDEHEKDFAEAIIKGLNLNVNLLGNVKRIQPLADEKPSMGGGSTDVGDVSWVVPTMTFRTALFIPGTTLHSWQNTAVSGTSIATKGLINAAKVLSLTAIDLFSNSEYITEIRLEFNKKRGKDFKYESLLKDRSPALDYCLNLK